MATLHVRNVPEALYELLREQAERDGRSIGQHAVKLIERGLFDRGAARDVVQRATRVRSPFLRRFAESGKEIVVRAQEHARKLGATHVTPAHVLLAMLDDDVLAAALERAGITRDEVLKRAPQGPGAPTRVPFAPETKQLLETALRASIATHQQDITPEHLLFALESTPSLRGLSFEGVAAAHRDDYRAVTLTGDDDAWTAQLNELASDGWELVQIVDGRAVFRRA